MHACTLRLLQLTRDCGTAGDSPATDFDSPQDMDLYPEPPLLDDADMPADDPPEPSPVKELGSAAGQPSAGHTECAAEALPGSSSAAARSVSKAPEDNVMPTPVASKAVQQLVRCCVAPLLWCFASPLMCTACSDKRLQSSTRTWVLLTPVIHHSTADMPPWALSGVAALMQCSLLCRRERTRRVRHQPLRRGPPRLHGGRLRRPLLSWQHLRQLSLLPAGRSYVMRTL